MPITISDVKISVLDATASSAKALPLLERAIKKKRLGHALLFVGTEHAEMLHAANHMAHSFLCKARNSEEPAPCGSCKDCLRIKNGSHPNVQFINPPNASGPKKNGPEVGGTKEIGVDQIRLLNRDQKMRAYEDGPRFWIISQGHLLSKAAANAILKSLEEPLMEHYFIIFVPSLGLVLATIASRCQRLYFSPNFSSEKSAERRQSGESADKDVLELFRKIESTQKTSKNRAFFSAS